MDATTQEITRLLKAAQNGDAAALDRVMSIVYRDLRAIAYRKIRSRRGGSANLTLDPTELVNEAFLRLVRQRKSYDSRGHFFAIASRVMLRVLMDRHRAAQREKREGGLVRVSLATIGHGDGREDSATVPDLVRAMEKLESLDARAADVTKLRFLWGLTVPEIAETLDVSASTVEREWRFARRWLAAELGDDTKR